MKDKKRLAVIDVFLFIAVNLANKKPISNNELNNNNKDEDNKNKEVFEEEKYNNYIKDNENVTDKNTNVNNSNKLKENKKIGNLELSDINVEYSSNRTEITGELTNKESSDTDFVTMNILDNDNKVIESNNVYIGKVKSGSTKDFDFTTIANIVNLYNINFVK